MGARCIELDIHEKNNEPVVVHGTKQLFTTTYLPLEDCIDVIVKYGFKTSDPLVLFIEVLTENDIVLKKTSEIIKLKLGNRLLSNEFKKNKYYKQIKNDPTTNNYYKQFINEPIKNLLNKIIIVNTSGTIANLEDILDDDASPSGIIVTTTITTGNITTGNSTTSESKDIITTNVINSDNKKTDDDDDNNIMKRKFPYGDIRSHFSCNYDPVDHWKNKVNFVSLNFQTFDDALFKNYIMFKDYSLVHFSEISFD
jgi:hypothetical protein